MTQEIKIKEETGDTLKRISSLLSGGHELAKQSCPLMHSWELLLNSLQTEIDSLVEINDKPIN